MILVDANLLLYAYHPRAEHHEESRAWLEAVLSWPRRFIVGADDQASMFAATEPAPVAG